MTVPANLSVPVRLPPTLTLSPTCMNCEVKPLINDTLSNGHLCMKDTFQCTMQATFSPLKEDNLSIYNGQNDPSTCVRYLEFPHFILCVAQDRDDGVITDLLNVTTERS